MYLRQIYPLIRKTGIGNLFVKKLDPSITHGESQNIFCKFGRILSCKVAEENGKRKGFGYVQFNSEESAVAACNALHGTLVKGKKIYISKFIRKSMRTVAHGEAMKAVEVLTGSLQGPNHLFIARARKKARVELLQHHPKEIVKCHIEKLKASNLTVKNLGNNPTHPVRYSFFHSFGKSQLVGMQNPFVQNYQQHHLSTSFKKNGFAPPFRSWNYNDPIPKEGRNDLDACK